jgi:Cdc6-like AAA superfamily ATPase
METDKQQDEIKSQLAQIYTPGVPIKDPKLFSGREELLQSLRDELRIPGKVFILYGERGVGKTSFYNILLHGRSFERYACTDKDTFISIFLNILRSLGEHFTETEISNLEEAGYEIGADKILKATGKVGVEEKLAPILPEPLDQASIIRRLKKVQGHVEAIVFDEFQNLKDLDVHAQMNDLVKALSDEDVSVRIIFVGIAESDEALFARNKAYMEYKMRHYRAVRIPRMAKHEIEDIIDRRKNMFNIRFLPEVTGELAGIASGYPSVAHTLALHSTFASVASGATEFVTSWAAKLIVRFFGGPEIKVEKIKLEVTEKEFARGVLTFVQTFHSSYENETKQLLSGLNSKSLKQFQGILFRLADSEDGSPSRELAKELGMAESDLKKMLASYPNLIVRDKKTENYRLGFSHLRTVVRAHDYLRRSWPDRFRDLLKQNDLMAKQVLE